MDHARFGPVSARGVAEVRHALRGLTPGWWGVVITFEGEVTAVRFTHVEESSAPPASPPWPRPTGQWRSSLDEQAYLSGVDEVRRRVAAGTVYQVNLCRILSQPLAAWPGLSGLHAVLSVGNPAPFAGLIDAPSVGIGVVSASPELFLRVDGDRIHSGPIKGTATTAHEMLAKDYAENVMIVDLVRNDLSHVCRPGSVAVEALCAQEQHPGLVHLTSTVSGLLRPDVSWDDLLEATFPPGSVSGAPKSSALTTIADLEPEPRGAYTGAIGWIDNRDPARVRAELAVGIRSFFVRGHGTALELCFGTGAGITWGSDARQEWAETELKARRLIALASGHDLGRPTSRRAENLRGCDGDE